MKTAFKNAGNGRDEPMSVAIHMCMETMLVISLYSYLYFKLAKTLCLSYYPLCLLLTKIGEKDRTDSAWKLGWEGGEGWRRRGTRRGAWGRSDLNNVYTYEQT
jgi:hypothetical protein